MPPGPGGGTVVVGTVPDVPVAGGDGVVVDGVVVDGEVVVVEVVPLVVGAVVARTVGTVVAPSVARPSREDVVVEPVWAVVVVAGAGLELVVAGTVVLVVAGARP